MAPRRCKHVEYDYEVDRWTIRPIWNASPSLLSAHFEVAAPNEPGVQVYVETVATAIDQMVDAAAGVVATKLRMGSAALEAVGEIRPDAETESRSS